MITADNPTDILPYQMTFAYLNANHQLYVDRFHKVYFSLMDPSTRINLDYNPSGPLFGGTGGTVLWMNEHFGIWGHYINVSDAYFKYHTVQDVYHEMGRWFLHFGDTPPDNVKKWDEIVEYLNTKFKKYKNVKGLEPR
jgi:hypothetical protein